MSKGKAFFLCWASVMFIFISMLVVGIVKDELEVIPVTACLTGIGSLAGLFFAGSVMNNGVKGHYWNQNMFDSENGKTEKGEKDGSK